MADNATLPATGVVVRTKDHSAIETQIVGFDVNPAGAEQLMASAALADGTSNPTLPSWATLAFVFNGTTWDRLRGDTTSGAWVNVKASALPSGAATAAKQPALGTAGTASADVITVQGIASGTVIPISDGGGSITVDGTVTATVSSSGSDATPNVHRNIKGTTATLSSVNDAASSAQLLASNSNRLGVTFVNDSSYVLYIKFGTTATTAIGGYSYKLQPDDTLDLPSGGLPLYTGRIDGIWSGDGSGGVSITEYS